MDRWRNLSASEQGRGIESGEIDPRELTDAHLDAIEKHPHRDRMFARLSADRARSEADASAKRAKEGRRLSALDGVPIAWKDLYDTAGIGTEGGTRLLEGRVPERDSVVVERATRAGLICLGKTHTSELAFSGLGVNPMTNTPPNAHDPALAPGGSSSGAAASTALGLAAAGIGSDTGGSVRIPAGWNDLVGLKTTAGLIPLDGVVPLSPTYDTVGPLTRSVEDAARLFAILAAGDVDRLGSWGIGDDPFHITETLVFDGADDGVADAFEATMKKVAAGGATVTRGKVAEFTELTDAMNSFGVGVAAEGWKIWGGAIEKNPGVMYPPIEARFRLGIADDRGRTSEAMAEYARLSSLVQKLIGEVGLLAMPTTPIFPPPVDRLLDDADFFADRNLMCLRNTRIANLLGLSAITLPTATPQMGLMLVARPNEEWRLLRAGLSLEPLLRNPA